MAISIPLLGQTVIKLLAEEDQLAELPRLISWLENRQAAGQTVVWSALPLSDEERQKISQKLGGEEVDFKVNQALIGGLIIDRQGKRQDLSTRAKLRKLFAGAKNG